MLTNESFAELAEKYIDCVYRVALNALKNPADAEDVTQEVFLRLLRREGEFESAEHARHWLIRVAVNESRRAARSPWRRALPLEDWAEALTFETPERSGLFYAVMALPEKYGTVVYLHYYEGYGVKELSMLLRRPESTVKSQLLRARARLRETLEKELFND